VHRLAAGEICGAHSFGAKADAREAGRTVWVRLRIAAGTGRDALVRHTARRGLQRRDTGAERNQEGSFKRHRKPAAFMVPKGRPYLTA
jgi:hypothetical protein